MSRGDAVGPSQDSQVFRIPDFQVPTHLALRRSERGRMGPRESGHLETWQPAGRTPRTFITDGQSGLTSRSDHSQSQILPSD
jgi:hypothetical protein